MSKTKPKLLIIDGNAIIHRSFHALPPTLRTKDGTLVNAVYGFTSFLLTALNEFHPEYIILALDKKGATFRHETFADYKATRIKAPDELYEQIPLVKQIARVFAIPIFEKTGFEADDLIGTLCLQAEKEKNLETIIITGDLDTLQLVSHKTKVYTTSRGLSESVLYDVEKIKTRFNLNPKQIIDLKALAGDQSDNIPGAKGIGLKTATDLLVNFKNIEGVYQAVDKKDKKIKERTLELLKASRDDVFLSKSLATINCNAPIELSLKKAAFAGFNLDEILELFRKLEFRSLLDKAKSLRDYHQKKQSDSLEIKEQKISAKKEKNDYHFLKTEKEFANFLKTLKKRKEFAINLKLETINNFETSLTGLSFSWLKNQAFFVLVDDKKIKALKPILENKQILKTGHDLKTTWQVFKNLNIDFQGLGFDVMLASYLLNPGERRHDLDALAFLELGIDKLTNKDIALTDKTQLSFDFSKPDQEKIALLTNEGADLIGQLKKSLEKKLINLKLKEIFTTIEMPLIKVLAKMEYTGIKIDLEPIKKFHKEVIAKIKKLETEIYFLAGKKFNINSTKQLKEILFVDLEIPTFGIKKTKTGFSTAEEELIKLKDLHPIIPYLQDYRELTKLETTYLSALPKIINTKTGKIHTHFNQAVTATGRLSSNDPNLQNIPARTEEGRKIREAFVAEKGFKLLGLDYSQIELRLAAHMSQDKNMIKAFNDGEDIHAATAAKINDIPLEKVSKQQRREAKATNFGILYGQGPHGLSQAAGINFFNAKEFIKKYFASYPGIKKMVDHFIKEAEKNNYAITLFGRKRPLPDINSSLPMVKKAAERMATNTPIQGTAADLIKLAMIKIGDLIEPKSDEIHLLLQVHDELIFEVKEEKLDYYAKKIKKVMEEIMKLKVPIVVDVSWGKNWGELK